MNPKKLCSVSYCWMNCSRAVNTRLYVMMSFWLNHQWWCLENQQLLNGSDNYNSLYMFVFCTNIFGLREWTNLELNHTKRLQWAFVKICLLQTYFFSEQRIKRLQKLGFDGFDLLGQCVKYCQKNWTKLVWFTIRSSIVFACVLAIEFMCC